MASIHVYVRASGSVTNEQAEYLKRAADALSQSLVDAGVDAKCGASVELDEEPNPDIVPEGEIHADPVPPDDSVPES